MKRTVEALSDGTYDLLILGGGITGAGVALDAVTRGLRVALIDKGDFASGTSSASSKLVHGGLRYLEHGNFRLVAEALHERRLLLRNAPHLVRPLRFLLPFYQGARVATWKWRAGLFLYDLLAGSNNLQHSRHLGRTTLLSKEPSLRPQGLIAGASYFDAQMDDARLCIEVLQTAWQRGAIVANYVEATAFAMREGLIHGVRCVDRVSGRSFHIEARQVLNATGPWVDGVCRLAGDNDGPRLQPTKGVHLIVRNRGFNSAFLLLHPSDGRVFFVIPWLGKTLIGTTDTEADAPPDQLAVTPAEVQYLLEGYNHFIREPLETRDVLNSFAGLRPLLRAHPTEPSARSREFRLFTSPSGLLTAAGGKYTTYRSMAESITDAIMKRLARHRPGKTQRIPLDGAPATPWPRFRAATLDALRAQGLEPRAASHLIDRYGRRALDVADYVHRDTALAANVHADEPELLAEFAYQRDHEMAIYREDFLLRRTRVGLFHPRRSAVGAA